MASCCWTGRPPALPRRPDRPVPNPSPSLLLGFHEASPGHPGLFRKLDGVREFDRQKNLAGFVLDIDSMLQIQPPLPHRRRGQVSGRVDRSKVSGCQIGKFQAFVVRSVDVVQDMKAIQGHGAKNAAGRRRFPPVDTDQALACVRGDAIKASASRHSPNSARTGFWRRLKAWRRPRREHQPAAELARLPSPGGLGELDCQTAEAFCNL